RKTLSGISARVLASAGSIQSRAIRARPARSLSVTAAVASTWACAGQPHAARTSAIAHAQRVEGRLVMARLKVVRRFMVGGDGLSGGGLLRGRVVRRGRVCPSLFALLDGL